jgi:hypothetical protein
LLLSIHITECTRGAVKSPVGQGDKGVGFKIPVLDLFHRDTYDPEMYATEDIDLEKVGTEKESPHQPGNEPEPSSSYDRSVR